MAMNFKIFENKQIVSEYAADLFRKQLNNNPTSIVAVALNDEADLVLDAVKADVQKNAVDMSQIHVFDYDQKKEAYSNIGLVERQYHAAGKDKGIIDLIKSEAKTKENKGKLTTLFASLDSDGSVGYQSIGQKEDTGLRAAREIVIVATGANKASLIEKLYQTEAGGNFEAANLKTHRMVNVILDLEAAAGLPEDVKEYYFSKFA